MGGADGVLEGVSFAPHDIGATPTRACFLAAPARGQRRHPRHRRGSYSRTHRQASRCWATSWASAARRKACSSTTHEYARARRCSHRRSMPSTARRTGVGIKRMARRHVDRGRKTNIHADPSVANAWDDETSGCPSMIAACWPPDCVNAMASERRDILGDWAPLLGGDFSGAAVTQLVQFSGHGGAAKARVLCSGAHLDHCKVHPAVGGLENKFVYASAGAAVARGDVDDATYAAPQPPQAFVRVDVSEDAVVDSWFCGERRFTDDAVLAAQGKTRPTRSSSHRYMMPRRGVYDRGPRLWCGHGVLLGPSTVRATSPRDPSASSPCPTTRHLSRGAYTAPGAAIANLWHGHPPPPSMRGTNLLLELHAAARRRARRTRNSSDVKKSLTALSTNKRRPSTTSSRVASSNVSNAYA